MLKFFYLSPLKVVPFIKKKKLCKIFSKSNKIYWWPYNMKLLTNDGLLKNRPAKRSHQLAMIMIVKMKLKLQVLSVVKRQK